jgi:hypothetical protein
MPIYYQDYIFNPSNSQFLKEVSNRIIDWCSRDYHPSKNRSRSTPAGRWA